MVELFVAPLLIALYFLLANFASYYLGKRRILHENKWDLNICCGKTDGGGVNADIVKHQDLPRFQQLDDIYNLPFANGQFGTVLCSHTLEHVDDPKLFYAELQRVGKQITIVVPPLYDLAAVFNILEHKWIFLSFKKQHQRLPRHIRLPFAQGYQRLFGQRNSA